MASKAERQSSDSLRDFVPLTTWLLQKQGGGILKTPGGAQWFIRKHREQLAKSGQLILRAGPGGHHVGPRFGDVVLEILRAESSANV